MPIDFSDLFAEQQDNTAKPPELLQDTSGRPQPKGAVAILDSGLRIPCALVYDGLDHEGDRRYNVVAELDWRKHRVVVLEIDEWPRDCGLHFRVPDIPDDERVEYCRGLEVRIKHTVAVGFPQ